jgi:spore coat protein U-like protein
MKFARTLLSTLSAAAVGLMALGLTAAPAQAGTTTASIAVSATVAATCSVLATPMAFGSYAAAVTTSTATVTTTCTNTTPYTVALNAGLGTSASVTARSMTLAGVSLGYGLYSDATWTTNFVTTASTNGNGAGQLITVYGQIPAGQYVKPGLYADTITATVTY